MAIKKIPHITTSTLLALFLLSACKGEEKKEPPQAPQGLPARVEFPKVREVTEWNKFTGRFQAQKRVEVRARVGGYLNEIKFEDGQIVQKDAVLFVVDQRPFKIALAGARARFDSANNDYKRAKSLRVTKAISEEDYDERRQAMRMAKALLNEAKLNLEFTEVKAPITGRISNNRIDVGNLVNGDATLLTTIVSLAPIELYFQASETDFLEYTRARMKDEEKTYSGKNLPVFVKLQDEKDFLHEGKINFADNELAKDTATIQMRAIFENATQLFQPGMFAQLRIATGKSVDRVLISPNIVGTEQTRKYVYVVNEENKAMRKYVTLGNLTEDGLQIVREGLSKEDRMIVGRLQMVRPGSLIVPIEAKAETQAKQTKETKENAGGNE